MKIAGAIIAGGRSSRMGGISKAFTMVGGTAILDRVIARLGSQTGELIVNANSDPEQFAATGLTVVPDRLTAVATPLAGLHASLAWASSGGFEWLLTSPSDTPFLPADLAARLLAAAEVKGAAIAASGGQDHYIIGVWNVLLSTELQQAIVANGVFRVMDWVRRVNASSVEWPIAPYDPFFNVNTPEDLAEAQRIAMECGA